MKQPRVASRQPGLLDRIFPFERAHDYFGDGSLYVIDAPGHIVGHINLLVRTDPKGNWALLAGDSAHDTRLLTAEKQVGHYHNAEGILVCMHADVEKAKDHIRRITHLPENVQIWIAHDPLWKEKL
jgi:glyoxylase-like metal-dependent hydrolase (beta-lactamase superfamily II)